jgi:hypothetical protein
MSGAFETSAVPWYLAGGLGGRRLPGQKAPSSAGTSRLTPTA